MPVCSGSFTGWRSTTLGAWSSSTRVSSAWIGPLPSSGTPRGSITRPRNPSPTGIDRILPVCLTRSPSSIWEDSPRMMQPISSSSRLNARPSTPPGNSSSSLAIAPGSPFTRAMPSPASTTRPTSSRSTEGVKLSTFLRRASAISFGSKFSSSTAIGFTRSLWSFRSAAPAPLAGACAPTRRRSRRRPWPRTPPSTSGSTMTLISIGRPAALESASASFLARASSSATAVRTSATARSRVAATTSASASTIRPTSRARPCSMTNPSRLSASGLARSPRVSAISCFLFSGGSDGSTSASRTRVSRSSSAANANSCRSTASSSPSASARRNSASA